MVEFSNDEKQVINTSQKIYDSFNDFIFSNDTKVFSKLIARTVLFKQVMDVPGDIVECGVFKGSGVLTWLKLKHCLAYNSFKKIVGFDFFNTAELLKILNGIDRERMEDLFISRGFSLNESYVKVLEDIIHSAGFSKSTYELISGDISNTAFDYVRKRPGAKISLLYLDLDLEKPTYDALGAFWDIVSVGGIVVFDEYAYHQWSEARGADRFFNSKKIKIVTLPYNAPTAYVVKE